MMATKVVPVSAKPKQPFILRVPPHGKLGQDLRGGTSEPKTIHQLVLEHFLDFLPKPLEVHPSHKAQEMPIIMKRGSSCLQNKVQPRPLVKLLPRGVQQKQETVSLCFRADSETLMVFEDLNVNHSQEECVNTCPIQHLDSEKENSSHVGEMMLLVSEHSGGGGDLQKEGCGEPSSDAAGVDCWPEGRLSTPIPQQRKLRSLLVTIENDSALDDLSKYVDVNIAALAQAQKTKKWHTCPVCGKQFGDSAYLVYHQRTHTGEKPYKCSHCGKRFNHKTNLNKHERIHTGEKPYSCSQCGKNFRQNSHRSRHEGIHTREKVSKCSECGKTFPKNEDFLLHLQSHEAERPYSCRNCGRRFGRLSNCTRHERTHSACKTQKQN